jgi:hypothetical protein
MTVNRDGTIASASREELKLAKMLAKDSRGRAGRFGGRDGKMARIRQMEQEQAAAARAKLGVELPKSGGKSEKKDRKVEKSEKRKRQAEEGGSKKRSRKDSSSSGSSSSEDDSDSSDTNVSQEQQEQQQQASKPKPPVYIVRLPDDGKPVTPFKPTPGEGWWGAKLFASAGCLGGLDEAAEHVSRERKTFNEDDQTALYMSAHDKQRQGRRGLGKSTTLKIAGGKWEGTKVTFNEEGQQQEGAAGSSGEAAAEAVNEAAAAAAGSSKKSKSKSEKKDKAGKKKSEKKVEKGSSKGSKGSGEEEAGAAGSSSGGRVKWAKLAQKVLKKQPEQQMRFKHLWRALLDLGHHEDDADVEALQALCLKKLRKCEAVKVEGKVVQLLA